MLTRREQAIAGFAYAACQDGTSFEKMIEEIEDADLKGLFADDFLVQLRSYLKNSLTNFS